MYKLYLWLQTKIWGPPKQKMLSNLFGEFMSVGPEGPFTSRMMEQLAEKRDSSPVDHGEILFVSRLNTGEGLAFIDTLRK